MSYRRFISAFSLMSLALIMSPVAYSADDIQGSHNSGVIHDRYGQQAGSVSSDGTVRNRYGQSIGSVPPGNKAAAFGLVNHSEQK